jgi:hypothetical protein
MSLSLFMWTKSALYSSTCNPAPSNPEVHWYFLLI